MDLEFCLTEEQINSAVEQVKQYLAGRKVAERDVLKLGLLVEEALLLYQDRFGRSQEVSVSFSRFAVTRVSIRAEAEAFNPLEKTKDGGVLTSEFLSNLLEGDGTSAHYRYRNGRNELIVMASRARRIRRIPGGAVAAAVLLAIVAAVITRQLPEHVAAFLVTGLAAPLFSRLMSLITLVAGPLIFISVVSGICALNDVATLNSLGLRAIGRFALITVMMITFSVAVCFLFFPGVSRSGGGAFDLAAIVAMLLELIPADLFSPFAENKTIQIIVLAIGVGAALLLLDEKTPRLRELVSEVNRLIFTVMGFVAKIIPFTVFLSIYKAAAQNSPSAILGVWKLVAANYAIMLPFTAGMVLYVCSRRRLSPRQFLRDVSAPAAVGFTTGSSTLAMAKQFETARDVMHKDEKLIGFWIPLSHAMFSPSVVPALVAAAFFAGSYYGTPVSVPQILILYILVTQLSIASPKVSGGVMATFSILLGQLGMPSDVIGLLMVANVFVVNAETGLGMIIRSAELEDFSRAVSDP